MVVEEGHAGVGGVISAHVDNADIVILLRGRDEIRLYLERIGRGGQAVADVNAAIVVGFLCRAGHVLVQHIQERVVFQSGGGRGWFQFEEAFLQFLQVAQQAFL